MTFIHKEIDFRISKRTLWIGTQAYPLSHITGVRTDERTPRHARHVKAYGRSAGATVGVGVFGVVILACLGKAVPGVVTVVFVVAVLGVLAMHTVRLIRVLRRGTLHVLMVYTAGRQQTTLVSTDRDLIEDLNHKVVDAIDNPDMEFTISVDHIEIVQGDKVTGNKYGGDHVDGGDKILGSWD